MNSTIPAGPARGLPVTPRTRVVLFGVVHESDINRMRREIRQLVLGIADMKMVYEAAETLRRPEYTPCSRVIETGMVVTYCRAYSSDSERRRPVTAEMLPVDPAAKRFHVEIVRLRDELYAHTDETANRVVTDPFGSHRYTEGHYRWKPEALDDLANLARTQAEIFDRARTEREDMLRAADVPTEPLGKTR